jgi:preprotein translocase subunit SecB
MTEEQKAPENNREFALQRIYLKDASFEAPNAPGIFQLEWEPESNVNLNSSANAMGNDYYEVVLNITLTTKVGDKTAYLVEVQQAGIFLIKGFSEQEMGPMIGSYCPNVLFPYAREAISSLASKGSFPQMLLAPFNFDALYAQHLEELKKKQVAGAESETAH